MDVDISEGREQKIPNLKNLWSQESQIKKPSLNNTLHRCSSFPSVNFKNIFIFNCVYSCELLRCVHVRLADLGGQKRALGSLDLE